MPGPREAPALQGSGEHQYLFPSVPCPHPHFSFSSYVFLSRRIQCKEDHALERWQEDADGKSETKGMDALTGSDNGVSSATHIISLFSL